MNSSLSYLIHGLSCNSPSDGIVSKKSDGTEILATNKSIQSGWYIFLLEARAVAGFKNPGVIRCAEEVNFFDHSDKQNLLNISFRRHNIMTMPNDINFFISVESTHSREDMEISVN